MNAHQVSQVLFDDCDNQFVTKSIYKRLDDFNRHSFTPALRDFMLRAFHVPHELRSELEAKNFQDLAAYCQQNGPWSRAFSRWHAELRSVAGLWKNVRSKSNVAVAKFRNDVKFIIDLSATMHRQELCKELLDILYLL